MQLTCKCTRDDDLSARYITYVDVTLAGAVVSHNYYFHF